MPLDRYHRKRDFAKTPEPAGDAAASAAAHGGGRFVVQRHRATRLHWDFRLEIGGVLASWAVPKGPSLDPAIRRMAVHVEDHPIEYFDFEGVIPARQYGAGDVIVWDWGTYEPESETPNPEQAIADGELKFQIYGEKLKGRFTLVRTDRRGSRAASGESDGEQWLLIHKRDAYASAGWDAEDFPTSVKSGRTNDDVKAQRDAVWISAAPAARAEIDLSGAETTSMPAFIEPMNATLADHAFSDPDWLFEVKWDGYRIETVVDHGIVHLWTRNHKDGETYFPGFLKPASWIDAEQAIVDGEVVALDEAGKPDFSLLQERISSGRRGANPAVREIPLVYQVFDLLYLDGRDLTSVPLEERKRLLRSVLKPQARVKYASHIEGDGVAFFAAAKDRGLEGVIAKHRRSLYESGHRSKTWLKIKVRPEQELVVGGYLPGQGTHTELGALIVGTYEGGRLQYGGRVGSGIDGRTRADLRARLDKMVRDSSPFDPAPEREGDLADARWVDPTIVIRVEFSNWTRDNLVRQASFKGLDLGKDPKAVVRERPTRVEDAERDVSAGLSDEQGDEPNPPTRTRRRSPTRAVTSTDAVPSKRAKSAADVTPVPGSKSPAAESAAPRSAPSAAATPAHAVAAAKSAAAASTAEVAALDAMGADGIWQVGGRDLKVTNLDKVIFPGRDDDPAPVTKRDLIRYFALIGPALLPHLADRPLNLHRFPNGAMKPGFWQKTIPPGQAPPWLRTWLETHVGEDRTPNLHVIADQVASLCWLGNLTAFEIHAWTSKLPEPTRPTFALIDIDPGPKTTWDQVVTLAKLYRTALNHLKVRAYPKVTGRRGIQAWIPIVPHYDFRDTSDWVEGVSRAVGAIVPELVSWEWSVANRKGLARLDYTQNASIKTLVAPYAVRPAPGAPVSAPIEWDELDDPALRPDRWTIRSVIPRVTRLGDLFAGAATEAQELPKL